TRRPSRSSTRVEPPSASACGRRRPCLDRIGQNLRPRPLGVKIERRNERKSAQSLGTGGANGTAPWCSAAARAAEGHLAGPTSARARGRPPQASGYGRGRAAADRQRKFWIAVTWPFGAR